MLGTRHRAKGSVKEKELVSTGRIMKKLVMILFGVFLLLVNSISVKSALTDSLIACYDFDGDTTDLTGNYDLTDTGLTFVTGYSGQAVQGTGSDVAYSEAIQEALQGDITVIFRVNTTRDTTTNMAFLGLINTTPGSYDGFFVSQRRNNDGANSNKIYGAVYENEESSNVYTQTINDGSWHYIAIQLNDTGDNIIINVDNTFYNQTKVFDWDLTEEFQVGKYASSTTYLDTVSSIDTVMVYNRSLLKAEMTEIYANNYACSDILGSPSVDTPSLQMFSNLADTINVNTDLLFTYNGTPVNTNTSFNCTLYIDTVANQTDYDVNITWLNNFTWGIGGFEGNFSVEINCSNDEVMNSTGRFYYVIDPFIPSIVMLQGFTNNSQIVKDTSLILSFNISDTNLFAYNISIFDVNGVEQENYFTENLTLTSYINTTTRTLSTTGNYSVRVEAWDSHTKVEIPDYEWHKVTYEVNDKTYKGIQFDNNALELATDDYSKLGGFTLIKKKDRFLMALNFSETDFYFTLYLKTDKQVTYLDGSGWPGHFIIGRKHWIDFNSDDITDLEIDYLENYNVYRIRFKPQSSIVVFKSIGDLNYASKTWYYQVVSQDTLYLAQLVTLQTQTNNFLNNIYLSISMIAIVILYLGLTYFSMYFLQTGNFMTGITSYFMSLGLDFYILTWIYQRLKDAIIDQGFVSTFLWISLYIFVGATLMKVISILFFRTVLIKKHRG